MAADHRYSLGCTEALIKDQMEAPVDPELPPDVLEAIEAGRKIQAIKLLREGRNLNLKDAKETVEAHIAQRPDMARFRQPTQESSIGRLLFVGLTLGVAYIAYRAFS